MKSNLVSASVAAALIVGGLSAAAGEPAGTGKGLTNPRQRSH